MVRNEDMLNVHETEIYNHWQLQLTRELTKLHLGRCHPFKKFRVLFVPVMQT